MRASEALRKTRDMIAVPDRWTQKAYARDGRGESVLPVSAAHAKRWCLVGALCKITAQHPLRMTFAVDYLTRAANMQPGVFNDTHAHDEVLGLCDRAILLAESEEVDASRLSAKPGARPASGATGEGDRG